MVNKMDKCKNCGHPGSMHSDQKHTHTGECFTKIRVDDNDKIIWCDCKKFVYVLEGER